MKLEEYTHVIINTSGGKDSLVAMAHVYHLAIDQGYPLKNIHASHQDLGVAEWPGTTELVIEQAELFDMQLHISRRRDKDGHEETFLEYVRRRKMWPSSTQRWCTSDFKRGPGARVVTALTKGLSYSKVLYVFGFRADESPARKKRPVFARNERLTTKKRIVDDWLPVHGMTTKEVWETIHKNRYPYHYAYDAGMPRLSCAFCIFSPFDALVLAGYKNPELLQDYVDTEIAIGHTFRKDTSLVSVQQAIQEGYQPKKIPNFRM